MKRLVLATCLFFAALTATPVHARQAPADREDVLNLFFDCTAAGCGDLDYFRRELPFVSWVRNREDADLHVLVTSQPTGGGGLMYTLDFIGLGAWLGEDQDLTVATPADATVDDQRSVISSRLGLGLVRYVQDSPVADRLTLTVGDGRSAPGDPARPRARSVAPDSDPWDFWVFRLNLNGNANGESTSKFSFTRGGVSANRTTDTWKLDVGANFLRRLQKFDFTDQDGTTRTVSETEKDWNANSSVVRSLGEQWAIGVLARAGSSTRRNQDLSLSVEPGIEYNFFPYSQSSRRSLTLQYLVGPTHFDYTERTIFDETAETRFRESLTGRIALIEPWGRWSTSVTASHYLHDVSRSNVTVFGNVNLRLFRGFSVFANANYQWIRDELFISAVGATTEQVLLRQRQLETSYRYFYSFGIQYQFGSIFNNVVNPRFGGGNGGGGQMMIFN